MPDLGDKPPKTYPSPSGYASQALILDPTPDPYSNGIWGNFQGMDLRQFPGEGRWCSSQGFGFPGPFPGEGLGNHARERQTLGINFGKKAGNDSHIIPRTKVPKRGNPGNWESCVSHGNCRVIRRDSLHFPPPKMWDLGNSRGNSRFLGPRKQVPGTVRRARSIWTGLKAYLGH